MRIKKIEDIGGIFEEHLSKMLFDVFHSQNVNFTVDYFIGENMQKQRYVCFVISSNIAENVYEKITELLPHQVVSDVEEQFQDQIIADLVISGIAVMQSNKVRMDNLTRRDGKIIEIKEINLN